MTTSRNTDTAKPEAGQEARAEEMSANSEPVMQAQAEGAVKPEADVPVPKEKRLLWDVAAQRLARLRCWWSAATRRIGTQLSRLNPTAQRVVESLPWLNATAERIKKRLEEPRRQLQPLFDWLINRGGEKFDDSKLQDFVAEADYAILRQEPIRARALLRALLWITGIFLVWASFAHVDEVTRGEGKVIPYSQIQVLQSLDGGIVSELLVREGNVVQKDQELIRIDQTRFLSSVKESRAQYLSMLAKAARLRALAEGSPFVPPEEAVKEDPTTAEEERRLYEARKSELDATVSIARQQLAQRQQELVELRAKQVQASNAYDLTAKELAATKPLLASGAVSDVEILRLERDVSRFRGERDMASAQIARVSAAIAESTRKVQEVELAFRNEARKEMNETLAKLNSLSEGSVGLSDKVARSVIRSPVKGTVKRLMVNTVGGVVQPGKDVIEIVPLEDNLLLEARVQPKDIAFLRPGLKATVKFSAYDFVVYGGLEGTLENIGADTVLDEKGNAFYTVKVRTNKSSLGEGMPIMPGMVAEVDILTGEKSVLSYLLKPVLRAKSRALSER
ncbi:HlyD family type I secretion periplasmic adaptor subunit [Candidatus Ferrigenium straubiae]|jgi:adhesin transport system membrane fusion protein|uniref:HlyD family type I secretion periplasmic adaptor subunit n=1 Tax=Candidatus Ferrigenium straubiae TaxID=2919506 RepID=UPI003F4AC257